MVTADFTERSPGKLPLLGRPDVASTTKDQIRLYEPTCWLLATEAEESETGTVKDDRNNKTSVLYYLADRTVDPLNSYLSRTPEIKSQDASAPTLVLSRTRVHR